MNGQSALRQQIYNALLPAQALPIDRSNTRVLAQEVDALISRLQLHELPADVQGYVVQELEARLSLESNTGNRTQETMERMVDNSDAAQQARRVLGDAWVQQQLRNRQR